MGYIDNPIESWMEDSFGFSRYSNALTQVVKASDTPLTIGIFGPWGSGKTSLLRLIKEDIEGQRGEGHWQAVSVWFNAWQYDREEPIWRALVIAVIEKLRKEITPAGGNQPEGIASDATQQAIDDLDRIEESLYHTVEWQTLGKWTIDWVKALEGTVRGATRIALEFVPGASGLAGAIESAWSELRSETTTNDQIEKAAKAIRQEAQKYRREQVRSLEQFQKQFTELVGDLVLKNNKRLVIFIDDLDRCLPEKAIEILEAIKLFLNAQGCIFLLAADRDVIEKGIRVKYQNFVLNAPSSSDKNQIEQGIPIDGRDYIEKIVQLPFSLPPIKYDDIIQYVTKAYTDLEEVAQVIATGVEANPRKIKRTLNLLRLLFSLEEIEVDKALLAKVVVIQNRYSNLYKCLIDYPRLLLDLEDYFLQRGSPSAPPTQDKQIEETRRELLNSHSRHKALQDMLMIRPHFASNVPQDDLRQIRQLLYLTRATSEEKGFVDEEQTIPIWDKLRSGDMARIHDTIDQIQPGLVTAYAEQIAMMLARLDLPPIERRSLGLAWGLLGYPQDLDDFVPIPGTSHKIGKYPVTNRQFSEFMRAGGYEKEGYWEKKGWQFLPDDKQPAFWTDERLNQLTQPVVGVSWYDAQAYCKWLSEKISVECRLPTETEWMLAASGAAEGVPGDAHAYPWGEKFDPGYANTRESGLGVTTPVGCYPLGVSPSGAFDMSGNAREWVQDVSSKPGNKITKGSSWKDSAEGAVISAHSGAMPHNRFNNIGFRVLCEA